MLKYKFSGLRRGVLSFSILALFAVTPLSPLFADEELPPPPADEMSMDDASAGAELPPPPPGLEDIPSTTADATAPPDAALVDTPAGEEIPPLPLEGDPTDQATLEPPMDSGLTDAPMEEPLPPAELSPRMQEPTRFSSNQELDNLSMEDRLKSKDLVLWLFLGGSYGSLATKGTYASGATAPVGGMGYDVGIGWMMDDFFQMQFEVMGTPRTRTSVVQHAMFGFGPRLGILSVMGMIGNQRGEVITAGVPGSDGDNLSIGVKGGLDLIFRHAKDSRVSIGIAPEAFYMTTQGADGYTNMGIAVNLRIYGYDSAF